MKKYNKRSRSIPFFLTPSCWFTSGKNRDKARAKHEYRGEDLERVLLDIEFDENDEEYKEGNLELDLKYKKIDENGYEKAICSLRREPWVKVIRSDYNPEEGVNGLVFELDWNDEFLTMLRQNGYTGVTPDLIVNSWFDDLCKTVAYEDGLLDGTGEPSPLSGFTNKTSSEDGITEYS